MTISAERFRLFLSRSTVIAVLLFCFAAAIGCGAATGRPERVFNGETMGTTYTVKVVGENNQPLPDNLAGTIQAVLEDVNAKMSTYRPDSELSRFNQHASQTPFPVSPETLEVFRIALEVSRQSGGAFDITVGPLVNAWGFGPDECSNPPNEETLAELRTRVGYHYLEIRPEGLVKKRPDLCCDLSAVAKGYAVDRVALALDQAGVQHYMAEVGGEVRARGKNASGVPWRIGIERPVAGELAVQEVIHLSGLSLATSGDYHNFFIKDGVRYSHTIDPKTGKPITHALASVSVVHASCAWADAYATAITVLGPEAGFALALEHHLPAYLIIHDGGTGFIERRTPAFRTLCEP